MSRLYFHAPTRAAEVAGAERAWLGGLCRRVAEVAVAMHAIDMPDRPSPLRAILPRGAFPLTDPHFERAAVLYLCGLSSDGHIVIDGEKLPTCDVALNTVMVLGAEAVQLAARLHGHCESHCYVEGEDRPWLAAMIERAVESRTFRDGMGWGGVVALLREPGSGPIVCSYSVCDSFPSAAAAEWPTTDDDGDAWYALSADEQWERSVAGIRRKDWLRLQPDGWSAFRFGTSVTFLNALWRSIDGASARIAVGR